MVKQSPVELSVNVEQALVAVQALETDGNQVRLGTLWEDQPAILIFIREFS